MNLSEMKFLSSPEPKASDPLPADFANFSFLDRRPMMPTTFWSAPNPAGADQIILDVWSRIYKQGGPGLSEPEHGSMPVYRNLRRGTGCAVGVLLEDHEYTPTMEKERVENLFGAGLLPRLATQYSLIIALQRAHDGIATDLMRYRTTTDSDDFNRQFLRGFGERLIGLSALHGNGAVQLRIEADVARLGAFDNQFRREITRRYEFVPISDPYKPVMTYEYA